MRNKGKEEEKVKEIIWARQREKTRVNGQDKATKEDPRKDGRKRGSSAAKKHKN